MLMMGNVSLDDDDIYRVVSVNDHEFMPKSVFAINTNGDVIMLFCDSDGYYRGNGKVYRVPFEPLRYIKEFKLC